MHNLFTILYCYVDVYDCEAWIKSMGSVVDGAKNLLERLGLLFCVDGIPAFNHKEKVCSFTYSYPSIFLLLLTRYRHTIVGGDITHACRVHGA